MKIAIEDNGIGISLEAQKQLFKIDSFHSTLIGIMKRAQDWDS